MAEQPMVQLPERYRARAFLSRTVVILGKRSGGGATFFSRLGYRYEAILRLFSSLYGVSSRFSSYFDRLEALLLEKYRLRRSGTRGLHGLPGPLRGRFPRLRRKDPLPPGTRRSPRSFHAILPVPAGRQRRRLRGQRLPRRRMARVRRDCGRRGYGLRLSPSQGAYRT